MRVAATVWSPTRSSARGSAPGGRFTHASRPPSTGRRRPSSTLVKTATSRAAKSAARATSAALGTRAASRVPGRPGSASVREGSRRTTTSASLRAQFSTSRRRTGRTSSAAPSWCAGRTTGRTACRMPNSCSSPCLSRNARAAGCTPDSTACGRTSTPRSSRPSARWVACRVRSSAASCSPVNPSARAWLPSASITSRRQVSRWSCSTTSGPRGLGIPPGPRTSTASSIETSHCSVSRTPTTSSPACRRRTSSTTGMSIPRFSTQRKSPRSTWFV
mmetsp:Transcript_46000/g.127739  ORF Transcript_46000/g.127739 Transcript_46000/m.127739 type:complete len:275 (-) Transcript_46000:358-1182(-)